MADSEGLDGATLYVQVKTTDKTVMNSTTTPEATLTADQAKSLACQIVVSPNKTVDTTVTPSLIKIS
ncbi:hypothetical protein [Bifidobacterium tissieri]|uniref:hypothetical protein n=1 Tax=Bifidobacterium tissieri TaxID=1630162 RepID=UPI00123C6484|nr:hypothetical protein [Bifidobacterium tissieri]KAA8832609.1 hypothetical protein EM849_03645 [Bifidobacterium tissieri]